jgi:hypothetical protein
MRAGGLPAEMPLFPERCRNSITIFAGAPRHAAPAKCFSGLKAVVYGKFKQQLWILNIQKTLIQLDFGNPEPHNKVLAWRHPNMG